MVLNSHYTEPFRRRFFWFSVETSYWSRVQTTFLLVERKEASKKRSVRARSARSRAAASNMDWNWSAKRLRAVAAQRRQIWIEIGARSGSEALNVEDIRQTTQTTLSIKLSRSILTIRSERSNLISLEIITRSTGTYEFLSHQIVSTESRFSLTLWNKHLQSPKHPLYQSKYHIKIWKHS